VAVPSAFGGASSDPASSGVIASRCEKSRSLALARDDKYERKLVIRAASYLATVDTTENIAISSAESGNEIPLPQKAAVLQIKFIPRVVTPERLYRGSTMLTTTLSQVERVGGPVPTFPWIPALRDPQGREHCRTAKNIRE
jgi:hypothetical protein